MLLKKWNNQMPDIAILHSHLFEMSRAELENHRSALIAKIKNEHGAVDAESVPTTVLNELLECTRTLRRKTAGPPKPKADPKASAKPKVSAADLLDL